MFFVFMSVIRGVFDFCVLCVCVFEEWWGGFDFVSSFNVFVANYT